MRFAFIKTPDPVYISTEREAREYADLFAEEPRVGFDTETTGLGMLRARVKFFSLATAARPEKNDVLNSSYCLPNRHGFVDILLNHHLLALV